MTDELGIALPKPKKLARPTPPSLLGCLRRGRAAKPAPRRDRNTVPLVSVPEKPWPRKARRTKAMNLIVRPMAALGAWSLHLLPVYA